MSLRRLGIFAAVGVLYFTAGKVGLSLAFFHPSATPVWPPTGIALVALLLLGFEVLPGIFVGALLVNLTTGETGVVTSLAIAAGNTLEGVTGSVLVRRYARGREALKRGDDVIRFVILAAFLSPVVSATIGVASLLLAGSAHPTLAGLIWLTWWLGDMGGALIVAPALLLWAKNRDFHWSAPQTIEALALVASLLIVCQLVFGVPIATAGRDYPLEFLCVPILVWAAYRFGRREAATAVLLVAVLAVWGTLRGGGPFARPSPNESLLLLQAFLAVASVTSLLLASVVAERRAAEEEARELAVSDPLTGLGNYRHMIGVLSQEMQRFGRSGRRFALVLFDVDHLKKINDRHGHVTGSRALCRAADALRQYCRAMDSAARFGGDEFALVLPETSGAAARQIITRVAAQIANDGQSPPVSISGGYAVYPDDGDSVERLLEAADRQLYEHKRLKTRRTTV